MIASAARYIGRGTTLNDAYWEEVTANNPLIIEAIEYQGSFTRGGTIRLRSRKFSVEVFCKDLAKIAMRAIRTGQFAYRDLLQTLRLLASNDPAGFGKFLALLPAKQRIRQRI